MSNDNEVKRLLKELTLLDEEIIKLQEDKSEIDVSLKNLKISKESVRESLLLSMNKNGLSIYVDDNIGELSIRRSPDKFLVKDEDALMVVLKEYDRIEEFCKTSIKVDKRLLNGFFKELRKCDSVPDCVEIEVGEESIVFKSSIVKNTIKKATSADISDSDSKDFSLDGWDSI